MMTTFGKRRFCPNCGKTDFTDIRQFNLMFMTYQGVTEDSKSELYSPSGDRTGHLCHPANIQRTTCKAAPLRRGTDR